MNLAQHPSAEIVKLLNVGESGSGKTGALASLARAGYTLWILDFDNGLDILAHALRDDPAATARVNYKYLRDSVIMKNGVPKVQSPVHAWKDAGKTLAEWDAENFGPNDIIVVDTLTSASAAAFNEALALAGRLNQRPQQNDYGWMADSVLLFMDALTDADSMNCNVIVNTHVRYLSNDADGDSTRGLPNAKGQQIPKDIGKFFNSCILSRTKGQGLAAKRIISTKPQGVIEVKISNPFGVKDEYPVETGLASLFHDILGHGPQPSTGARPTAPSTHAQTTPA